MKVAVIGGGGREHAIIRKLKENPQISALYALPGNGGIGYDAVCVDIRATDLEGIVAFAVREALDFVVVAPDDPLALGLVDRLEAKAHLKGRKVTKYKYLGLMLFVAVPLPGTGAWTGALAAAFLDMPLRKALPSIFAGVLIAGFLILGLTYGFTSLF